MTWQVHHWHLLFLLSSKFFAHISTLCFQNNTYEVDTGIISVCLFFFNRIGNWGRKKLSNLSKITSHSLLELGIQLSSLDPEPGLFVVMLSYHKEPSSCSVTGKLSGCQTPSLLLQWDGLRGGLVPISQKFSSRYFIFFQLPSTFAFSLYILLLCKEASPSLFYSFWSLKRTPNDPRTLFTLPHRKQKVLETF